MKEKRYYWLKLYDTFFDNKTSKFLRKLPEGDKILLIYLKLQLKLLKSEGIFVYEHLCESMAEEIAMTLDEDVTIVKILLTALEKTKTIEFFDEDTFMLSEMQDLIGSEGSSAARVRTVSYTHLITNICRNNITERNKNFLTRGNRVWL